MVDVTERIRLIVEAIDKNVEQVLERISDSARKVNQNVQRFGETMNEGAFAAKKFTMQLLGVMFFGMALQRMFMGLLQPALDAFGVMELWNVMLLTVFIPTIEMIFPFLLRFMEFFMNLPEPVKNVLGIFTLLGLVFGQILMLIGQFALGMGSLIMLFPALKTISLAALGSIGVKFLILAGIIGLFFLALKTASDKNFMNIRENMLKLILSVKNMFAGLFLNIRGIMNILTGLITGDLEKVKQGFKESFKGSRTFVDEQVKAMINLALTLAKTVANVVVNIFKVIINLIGEAVSLAGNLISKVSQGVTGFVKNMNPLTRSQTVNDFIMRPGQAPISMNPNDTLVGFKGPAPNLGGGVTVNQTINLQGGTPDFIQRAIDDANKKLVDDIMRMSRV